MSQEHSQAVHPSGFSHSFDTGIAAQLGIHAAVVYNHIVYWLRINASKNSNFINGKTWMYETQKDIAEFLGYLSVDEVKKAIIRLVDSGILIKDCHNKNKFDRTAWYTVNDQNILGIKKIFTKVPIGTMHGANPHDGKCDTAPSHYIQQEQQEEKQQQQGASPPETPRPPAAVVVSFFDEEEKKDILKKIGFDPEAIDSICQQYDLERIKIALETLTQAQGSKDITNPCGFIVSALKCEWKASPTEESIQSEKEAEEKKKKLEAQDRRAAATALFNLYKGKFTNNFQFQCLADSINVKIKMAFAILHYTDSSCIQTLKKVIHQNIGL